uniref:14 kDa phosphohistidine phosphatase isoform X2 n=1 Tax=Urocitellus parryii TaxID=9999 RepID=UPI000E5588F3|nr:14 kDa phosphohistidine phosphatase isoform X2 [Urocitellus parryii]
MAAADLAQIPEVDIDPDGVFKYVLVRVHSTQPSGAPAGECKEIVRGYKWAEYHGRGATARLLPSPGARPGASHRSLHPCASREGLPFHWGRGCSEVASKGTLSTS